MSQMPEQRPARQAQRTNRFSRSREAHEEYVGNMASAMNKLADTIKAGDRPSSVSPPFCPTTGYAYGGASMTRLMLESMDKGYADDRWLTFKQLQNHKFESKNFKMKIKKGEHGVKLLRPEDVYFIVDKQGKWEFLEEGRAKDLWQRGADVQRKTLFHPFYVFNADQLEGFPPKEKPAPALSAEERNAVIDKFVACLGVKQESGHPKAEYEGETDTIRLPDPEKFKSLDDFYAMKLRLAFHATAHNDRERRSPDMFEVMRGETFSLLAGARLGLPMPADGGSWQEEFKGKDKFKAMEAAADASRMLAVLDQFSRGEEPKAPWFPKKDEWPALIAAQERPVAPASAMRMKA